jgi:hypothetical protein
MSVSISVLDAFSVFWHVDAICSDAKEKQGNAFPAGLRYIYSTKTSNTSLRPHLEKVHLQLYMQQKELQGWKNQLPRQASLATTAASLAQDVRIDTFDEETFHRYLINFIVVDDQVHVVFQVIDYTKNFFVSLVIECHRVQGV